MTIKELERIEDQARRGQPLDPSLILTLTAYLREVLQARVNAEAVAYEALKKAGINSRYYTAEMVARRDNRDDGLERRSTIPPRPQLESDSSSTD